MRTRTPMRVLLTIALTLALLPMLSTFAPGGQVAGFTTASPAVADQIWYQSVGRASEPAACEKSTATDLAVGWTDWAPSWEQWVNGGKGGFVCNRQITWAFDSVPPSSSGSSSVTCTTTSGGSISTPCALGTFGPGGGLIFLISDGRTYEMAPKTWKSDENVGMNWCSNSTSVLTGTGVGDGSANTTAMLTNAPPFVACITTAANEARGYSDGVFTDWFLPSRDELNAMCNYSRNPTTPPTGTCTGTQNVAFATGAFGFIAGGYWSSSQSVVTPANAYGQSFSSGSQTDRTKAGTNQRVRPVRAF